MEIRPTQLIADFIQVAKLARLNATDQYISCEILLAPHTPPSSLPDGKMAVYVFIHKGRCLKVGRVGPNSSARYTSQHYNPDSSKSNLAKSLLNKKDKFGLEHLDRSTVGEWIKRETDRFNFLLNTTTGIATLALLEIFLQCRLSPFFEGFESQE